MSIRLGAVLLCASLSEIVCLAPLQAQASISWSVSHEELLQSGQALLLDDSAHTFVLRNGWTCTLGATKQVTPADEARITTCRKAEEVFEFSVQCNGYNRDDHTQIRFHGRRERFSDFIDVHCKLE